MIHSLPRWVWPGAGLLAFPAALTYRTLLIPAVATLGLGIAGVARRNRSDPAKPME